MKKVLIITGRYLPGYKDGGPVRTLKNLIDSIGDRYNFTIMCCDRDHGDKKPYDNISVNSVNRVGNANVYYVKDCKYTFSDIKKLANDNDIVYVCGPYNGYAIKTLILKRFSIIKKPVVLAPMGSFSKGALALKSTKKKIFFSVFKVLGLFKNISFSVTSNVEEEELKEALNIDNKCYIAEDPQRAFDNSLEHSEYKKDDKLNIIFLSRICEKKNLHGAIKVLSKLNTKAVFHVYGNIEDEEYFHKAQAKMINLPTRITAEYMGEVNSENVPAVMSKYDVFLFPTLGENFGHVISEALLAGTIPVISNTTPWNDLNEKNAGFVCDLNDLDSFTETIEKISCMSDEEIRTISENARNYYKEKYEKSIANNGYVKMFDEL